jgi:hypothetical protein
MKFGDANDCCFTGDTLGQIWTEDKQYDLKHYAETSGCCFPCVVLLLKLTFSPAHFMSTATVNEKNTTYSRLVFVSKFKAIPRHNFSVQQILLN